MKKNSTLDALVKIRVKQRKEEEKLLYEVNRILVNDQFSKKNVLSNLKNYQKLDELVSEDTVDAALIYKLSEIKDLALKFRLKFLESKCYKPEYPEEVIIRLDEFNSENKKNNKGYKVLGTNASFKESKNNDICMLFAPTDLGNYYLVYYWGEQFKWHRKLLSWPIKNIENLFLFLISFTLIVTLLLPTNLITLDRSATYWCGYRIGVFFHLLIFFGGFTVYFTFAFAKNLSSIYWDRESNFG
jgi:hypothetical protein